MTLRPCCSQVVWMLQNRSCQRLPQSLCIPCVTLRSITTLRIVCSPGLFVGAMPCSANRKSSSCHFSKRSAARFSKCHDDVCSSVASRQVPKCCRVRGSARTCRERIEAIVYRQQRFDGQIAEYKRRSGYLLYATTPYFSV